ILRLKIDLSSPAVLGEVIGADSSSQQRIARKAGRRVRTSQSVENQTASERTAKAVKRQTSSATTVIFQRMEGRIFTGGIEHCFRNRIVVHSKAATEDDLLLVFPGAQRKPKPRSKVCLGRGIDGFAGDEPCIRDCRGPCSRQHQIAQQTLGLGNGSVVLIAQSDVESEIGRDFEIVLSEASVVTGAEMAECPVRITGPGIDGILFEDGRVVGKIPKVA